MSRPAPRLPGGVSRRGTIRTIAALALVGVAAGLAAGCGRLRVHGAAGPPPDADLILLLPDPERTTAGAAAVSAPGGSVLLDGAREFTLVGQDGGPARVRLMRDADVTRRFGDVLATLPPEPLHFMLFFRFESDELTDESRAMVPDVIRALQGRPAPEVSVVGHTDTTGTPANNYELGMKRSTMVRGLLVEAGLEPASIEIGSHGEGELLVPTPDDTYEPRNRRVEITIR